MKKGKKVSDKKIYLIFIAVMAGLYGAGYLVGKTAADLEDSGSLGEFLAAVRNTFTVMVPPAFGVLAVAALIVLLAVYASCKKMYKKFQDDPDEELWDLLEEKLNVPMILANVMQIVNVFFFGCILYIVESASYGKNGGYETVVVVIDVIMVAVLLAAGMLIPKGIVDIEKKLNPEKQGNVFDFRFNEVWLSNCDEAQQLISYKAAYHAFKRTHITCAVMWVLAALAMIVLKAGIGPLLCVCIIWFVNTLSYLLRAAKLEKTGLR